VKKIIILLSISILLVLRCAENISQENNNKNIMPINPVSNTPKAVPNQEYKHEEARADFSDTNNFVEQFTRRFPGFTTLQPKILAELVSIIPAQKSSWGCGLHQSEAAIETAYINTKSRRRDKTNFDEVCSYPLSVDININKPEIKNILNWVPDRERQQLTDASDDQGYFRVGALPHDLASYINTNLPNKSKFKAYALSQDNITTSKLLGVIKHNLALMLPTPVFYIISKETYTMHVYLITGLKNNKLLILDTSNEGVERFLTIDAGAFIKGMNAQPIIELVKQAFTFGPFLAGLDLKIPNENKLKLWKPYSVIEFRAE